MADNVTFQPITATPLDGTVIATDDCGGAQVQIFKQAVAADGSDTIIPSDAVNGQLVNLGANNDVTITSGTVTAVISGVTDVGEISGPVIPGSGATELGKAEDAAHASGDVGVMALGIRQDADAATAADGDYVPLQTDANGYLKVNIKAGAGSGGTSATDDAAFTAGSGLGTPMMGFVTADSVDSGDVGVIGMLANRQQKVTLYDSAGVEVSVGGGTQYAQGTVGTTTDVLTMAGAVRKDTAAIASGVVDGDRAVLSTDSVGRLRVTAADTTQPVSGTVSATVSGTVAATQSGIWNVTDVSGTVSLPTGAATSALQTTANGLLTTIDADTSALAGTVSGSELQVDVLTMPAVTATVSGTVAATQSGTWTVQPGNTANTTAWKVDGSAVTQPISGTVAATQSGTWTVTGAGGTFPVTGTFWQATQPISAAALPLPSGASTLAEQQTQTTSLQLIDDAIATTGSAIPTKGCVASGTDGTNARVLKTDASGELQIDVLTSALPSGAATETTLATLKAVMTVTALQVTASGDTTLIASGTRKIHRVEMSNSHASTAVVAGLKIASANGGAVFSKKYLPAAGGQAVVQIEGGYIAATSEVVAVNLSATGQVEVTAYYE